MEAAHQASAIRVRARIKEGRIEPLVFRAELLAVAPAERDAWLDAVLTLGELPDDGPDLPRDCVAYVPCPVDSVLRMVDAAAIRSSDSFVDIGSGVGRTAALVHLLTGAAVTGIEIQRELISSARQLAARLPGSSLCFIEGDASGPTGLVTSGSVFFLYCPFSGERLLRLLAALESLARARELRICCVDLPIPPCSWLTSQSEGHGDLTIHRSLGIRQL